MANVHGYRLALLLEVSICRKDLFDVRLLAVTFSVTQTPQHISWTLEIGQELTHIDVFLHTFTSIDLTLPKNLLNKMSVHVSCTGLKTPPSSSSTKAAELANSEAVKMVEGPDVPPFIVPLYYIQSVPASATQPMSAARPSADLSSNSAMHPSSSAGVEHFLPTPAAVPHSLHPALTPYSSHPSAAARTICRPLTAPMTPGPFESQYPWAAALLSRTTAGHLEDSHQHGPFTPPQAPTPATRNPPFARVVSAFRQTFVPTHPRPPAFISHASGSIQADDVPAPAQLTLPSYTNQAACVPMPSTAANINAMPAPTTALLKAMTDARLHQGDARLKRWNILQRVQAVQCTANSENILGELKRRLPNNSGPGADPSLGLGGVHTGGYHSYTLSVAGDSAPPPLCTEGEGEQEQ
ncbi:hypothetical protein B0H19DRAFT_1062609 [Mycena capillaripes]|nr:hypothetical protein B0H19DRAFT_1062609 [Mycena capillaripes]